MLHGDWYPFKMIQQPPFPFHWKITHNENEYIFWEILDLHQVFFLSMFMKLNINLSGCHYSLCNIYIGSWVWWEYRATTMQMNIPLAMVNFGGLCYLIGNIKLINYMKIACFQSLHVVKDQIRWQNRNWLHCYIDKISFI